MVYRATGMQLHVIVGLHQDHWNAEDRDEQAEHVSELAKDTRFMIMLCKFYLRDWQIGCHMGIDYWSRAEDFVAKRKRGEIDPEKLPRVFHSSKAPLRHSLHTQTGTLEHNSSTSGSTVPFHSWSRLRSKTSSICGMQSFHVGPLFGGVLASLLRLAVPTIIRTFASPALTRVTLDIDSSRFYGLSTKSSLDVHIIIARRLSGLGNELIDLTTPAGRGRSVDVLAAAFPRLHELRVLDIGMPVLP
ncbi:hypothetical protein C8R43DRAFT_1203395 [Mycena crocata]|nr:hypothetical protein C8R43DRAFT_1203395 [Mycena crocata]